MADINIIVKMQADQAVKDAKKLKDGLDKTEKSAQALSVQIKETSRAFSVFAGNIAAIGVAKLTQTLVRATKGLIDLGQASIQAASDAEETLNKFNVVFRDVSDEAESAANNLAKSFGLAQSEAKGLLADTADLLSGFGFTGKAALDLSTQVQELAVDLASFTNFSGGAQGASEALTKALLGERESVKALGIAILEEDIKKQVAINTAKGLTFESERQAKAQATLDIALRQSANAIGDFARSSESFANTSRILNARLQNIQETLGGPLLLAATALKREFIALIDSFDTQQVVDFVKNGIVSLLESLIAIIPAVNPVISAFKLLGDAFLIVQNLLQSGFGVIIAAFSELSDIVLSEINRILGAIPDFLIPDSFRLEFEALRAGIQETADDLDSFGDISLDGAVNDVNDLKVAFDGVDESLQNTVSEETLNKIRTGLNNITDAVKNASEEQLAAVTGANAAQVQNEEQTNAQLQELALERQLVEEETRLLRQQEEAGFFASLVQREQDSELKRLEIRRQAAINTINDKKKLNTTLARIDLERAKVEQKQEEQANAQRVADRRSTLNTLTGLTRSSNSALFNIGKAAAIATATIDGQVAVQKALASAPPPFNFALAALVGAATADTISRIASQKKPSFQEGGIVPGNSFSGDNVSAQVNSGEVILNRQQQAETLFAIANGAGGEGRVIQNNITLELDGEVVTRAVSRSVANGTILGEEGV